MTNYEKYFGDSNKAANTLEKINFAQIKVCSDLCTGGCHDSDIGDEYDCNNFIEKFLREEASE